MAAQGQNDRQQGVHSLSTREARAAHRPRGEGGGSGGGEGEVRSIISDDHNWRLEKEKAMTDGAVEPVLVFSVLEISQNRCVKWWIPVFNPRHMFVTSGGKAFESIYNLKPLKWVQRSSHHPVTQEPSSDPDCPPDSRLWTHELFQRGQNVEHTGWISSFSGLTLNTSWLWITNQQILTFPGNFSNYNLADRYKPQACCSAHSPNT